MLQKKVCSFQVGNVLELPYADNSYDVAISYRFMAHVKNWKQFVKELARVAKKAVIIDYTTVRSANAIAPYLFKLKKAVEGNTRPFICYEEQDLLDFFRTIGFKQGDRYAQFFLPMVLHRIVKSAKISSILENSIRVFGLTSLFGSPAIAKFIPENL